VIILGGALLGRISFKAWAIISYGSKPAAARETECEWERGAAGHWFSPMCMPLWSKCR